jgi:Ca2+-binding EF-hand superfamily protein
VHSRTLLIENKLFSCYDFPVFLEIQHSQRCSAGRIDAGDLLVALRALGFEPRKDEVKKLMSDNDKENTGTITKQQFVEIFRAKWVRGFS